MNGIIAIGLAMVLSVTQPVYTITNEEADLLLKVAMCEANDYEGMANVIQVIFNRRDDPRFPDNITDVLKAYKQFSSIHKAQKIEDPSEEATDALVAVVNGEFTDNEALYFESLPGKAWEKVHTYLFSYGGHDFYK